MTDFNLEQFKAGKKIILSYEEEGELLKIIKNTYWPFVVLVTNIRNGEQRASCYCLDALKKSTMKPEKKKLYIAIQKKPNNYATDPETDNFEYYHDSSRVYERIDLAEKFAIGSFCKDDFQIVELEIEV